MDKETFFYFVIFTLILVMGIGLGLTIFSPAQAKLNECKKNIAPEEKCVIIAVPEKEY